MDVFGHARRRRRQRRTLLRGGSSRAFSLRVRRVYVERRLFPSRVFAAESGNEASERFVFDESVEVGFVQVIFILASAAKEEPGFANCNEGFARAKASRFCKKPRNGATPVPGPIITIGLEISSGNPNAFVGTL